LFDWQDMTFCQCFVVTLGLDETVVKAMTVSRTIIAQEEEHCTVFILLLLLHIMAESKHGGSSPSA